MANKLLLLLGGGAGAVGAFLFAMAQQPGERGSAEGALEGAPVLVAVSAPAPARPDALPATPPASLQSPQQSRPLAVPSVEGGARPGQAGIWSIPAEFAPPD